MIVLPLAYADDLLFHCVVAVGGAHLSSQQSASNANMYGEIMGATMHHYSYVLRSLQTAILGPQRDNTDRILHVLLALVLTASYEVS